MITRFAPSPTGPLHLGHAYSAMLAHDMARAMGGQFVLRIEDIDTTRARPEWEELIYEDLAWLGLTWDRPPVRQSDRLGVYERALDDLWQRQLVYPCRCSRRDIATALDAPQEGAAPVLGPDGPVYPGTCRDSAPRTGTRPVGQALRLDMQAALAAIGRTGFQFTETGPDAPADKAPVRFDSHDVLHAVGDIVLSRRDFPGSYHLSVVLDDADQGITHVIRGADLADATRPHVVLQHLWGLPVPVYHHHRLIRDDAGKRLAKRDDARAIRAYRADGLGPDDIRRFVGLDPHP